MTLDIGLPIGARLVGGSQCTRSPGRVGRAAGRAGAATGHGAAIQDVTRRNRSRRTRAGLTTRVEVIAIVAQVVHASEGRTEPRLCSRTAWDQCQSQGQSSGSAPQTSDGGLHCSIS